MVPLMAIDLEESDPGRCAPQGALLLLVVLMIVTVQVTLVCVWRLVYDGAGPGRCSPHEAFRYVDVMIGAAAAAALLSFTLGVVLAPGDAVPPGMGPAHRWCRGAGRPGVGLYRARTSDPCCLPRPSPCRRRGAGAADRARRGDLMPIVVDIDVVLAKRKMSVGELAQRVGDHAGQPRRAQERPSQGRPLHHARRVCARCSNANPASCCAGNPPTWTRACGKPPPGL